MDLLIRCRIFRGLLARLTIFIESVAGVLQAEATQTAYFYKDFAGNMVSLGQQSADTSNNVLAQFDGIGTQFGSLESEVESTFSHQGFSDNGFGDNNQYAYSTEPFPLHQLKTDFAPVTPGEATVSSRYGGNYFFTGDDTKSMTSALHSAATLNPGQSSTPQSSTPMTYLPSTDRPSCMVKLSLPSESLAKISDGHSPSTYPHFSQISQGHLPNSTFYTPNHPQMPEGHLQTHFDPSGYSNSMNNLYSKPESVHQFASPAMADREDPFSDAPQNWAGPLSLTHRQPSDFAPPQASRKTVRGVALDGSGRTDFLHDNTILSTAETLGHRYTAFPVDSDTIFTSYEDALEWQEQQALAEQEPDDTIPKTKEQKRAIVKNLVKAFKTVTFARDSEHVKGVFMDEKHHNYHVELALWRLLEDTITRCTSGPLMKRYDPSKAKTGKDRCQSFEERMDEILESMKQYKTICKHIYDTPWFAIFIDNPVSARERVGSNKLLNDRKGQQIQAGKKADPSLGPPKKGNKRSRPTREASAEVSDNDGDYSEAEFDDSPQREHTATAQRQPRPRASRGRRRGNSTRQAVNNDDSPSNSLLPFESPSTGSLPNNDSPTMDDRSYFLTPDGSPMYNSAGLFPRAKVTDVPLFTSSGSTNDRFPHPGSAERMANQNSNQRLMNPNMVSAAYLLFGRICF